MIGGGDWAENRILTDIISACAHQKPLTIRYPDAVRPWQHVLECLSGYLKLAQNLYQDPSYHADAWNFGPDDSNTLSVSDLTNLVLKLWGTNISWEQVIQTTPHETTCLQLDSSKARNKLNWHPKWDVYRATEASVSFKAYLNGKNARAISLEQIKKYMNE